MSGIPAPQHDSPVAADALLWGVGLLLPPAQRERVDWALGVVRANAPLSYGALFLALVVVWSAVPFVTVLFSFLALIALCAVYVASHQQDAARDAKNRVKEWLQTPPFEVSSRTDVVRSQETCHWIKYCTVLWLAG